MNKTTLITFIPFIIVTCSCNRLSELKRTIYSTPEFQTGGARF